VVSHSRKPGEKPVRSSTAKLSFQRHLGFGDLALTIDLAGIQSQFKRQPQAGIVCTLRSLHWLLLRKPTHLVANPIASRFPVAGTG